MKIIANVPVRNEAWILPLFLSALEKIVDIIIVADQGSTDGSEDICARFSKVTVIPNESRYDESYRFQLLLEAAREFDGNNLIVALDADELLTADALGPTMADIAESLSPGQSAELQWIWLWNNATTYRTNGRYFAANWKPFVFRDDRSSQFEEGVIHADRVPTRMAANFTRFEHPKVLHYQFAHWNRALAKQRWYRCLERVMFPYKDPYAINATYSWFLKGAGRPKLQQVPQEWLGLWRSVGVDPTAFLHEDFFWFDVEVLRMFREYGLAMFADLDIWDVDWEDRRQCALRATYAGIPDHPLADPRSSEQRLAQEFTRNTRFRPPWRMLSGLAGESVRRARAAAESRARM